MPVIAGNSHAGSLVYMRSCRICIIASVEVASRKSSEPRYSFDDDCCVCCWCRFVVLSLSYLFAFCVCGCHMTWTQRKTSTRITVTL